jgi:hypothetical protein
MEIVQHHDVVTFDEQHVHDVGADETCAPRDQDAHQRREVRFGTA